MPFFGARVTSRGDARQRYLDHFPIELTLIDYSMSRHLPSHLACLAVIISNCFFSCPCAQQSPSPELEPKMLRQWLFGSDGDPTPRGVVGFVFPRWCCATSQCRSHLQSGLASGLEKLAPCRLVGMRGRTSDEGFMGARRSTGRGSARWFLFPTNTWEPLLLTWVVQVSARIDEL